MTQFFSFLNLLIISIIIININPNKNKPCDRFPVFGKKPLLFAECVLSVELFCFDSELELFVFSLSLKVIPTFVE